MGRKRDLTGQIFHMLLVLAEDPIRRPGGKIMWHCQCNCGKVTVVSASHLLAGRIRSCGCLQRAFAASTGKDRVGQRFGRLLVLSDTGKRKNRKIIWLCKCDCGRTVEKLSLSLARGTVSCGCYRKDVTAKLKYSHGMAAGNSKGYRTWYRAQFRRRVPTWTDLVAIKRIYEKCPIGYEVDHIVPLNGALVSGLHVPNNLQYLPKAENIAKLNYFLPQILATGDPQLLPNVYW